MIWNDQTILVFPHFFCLPDSLFWKVPFSKSNLKVKYPCEFWNVWYWKLKITFRSFKWGITHFCTLAMNRAGACFPNCVWKKSSFFARDCINLLACVVSDEKGEVGVLTTNFCFACHVGHCTQWQILKILTPTPYFAQWWILNLKNFCIFFLRNVVGMRKLSCNG